MKRKKAEKITDLLIEEDGLKSLTREQLGDLISAVLSEEASRRVPGTHSFHFTIFPKKIKGWSLGESFKPLGKTIEDITGEQLKRRA